MAIRFGKFAALLAAWALCVGSPARAQTDRPRFLVLLDNSQSMTQNPSGVETHGDGSQSQPGCDLDGKSTAGWAYDDSKLYQAKSAVIDTISAFGAAEFALATYSRKSLGQACASDGDCQSTISDAVCVTVPGGSTTQKYCAHHDRPSYLECSSGTGCTNCSNPSDTNDLVFEWGAFDCTQTTCSYAAGCVGGQVIVSFPTSGASNLLDIYHWIDGKEDLPPFSSSSNRELRAETMTPLASALDSMRAWLTDASKTNIGAGAGLLSSTSSARDPRASCRPYNVILITDGDDTCSPNTTVDPVTAATALYNAGINLYVVGFGSGFSTTVLNNMAMAGSGQARSAYFPSSRADLTASLGDILINALPKKKCNCDATCYDQSSAFSQVGQACTVGVGRCKRAGVYACNAAGDGVMCAASATCGATALVAGTPAQEQCGVLSGCLAPTAADCADENCDGTIDEGLSCSCAATPETCNGLDDNCDGVVDNISQVSCGLNLGACKSGLTTCGSDGAGGYKVVCQGEVGPTAEVCDGIDNDCNGLVDDLARSCYPVGKTGCAYDTALGTWSCVGACKTGMQACAAGAWQACVGAVTPVDEIACDGIDNNCDGQVDENDPVSTTTCYPANTVGCDVATGVCVGQCALGHEACAGNKMGLTCTGSTVPTSELCNGKDDDCDGLVDEDFPTLGKSCNEQSCQGADVYVCNKAGTDVECTVTSTDRTTEICDGIDNDCDGLIDEAPSPGEAAMPGVGVACGSNVGECKAGVSTCTNGKIVCNPLVAPTTEICDGKDNDCNGSIDDGVVAPADSCNPAGMASGQAMAGECKPGTFACKGTAGWACEGGVGPTAEICDGKDNDCDGVVDNNATCSAGYLCVSGECVKACQVGGEFVPCPSDRYCKDGACLLKACAKQPCTNGYICQSDGTCVDPCLSVTCLTGATCVRGTCVDCYTQGCATGLACIGRQCIVDPCSGITCGSGQFCDNGACVPSCAGVICATGQICSRGACAKSACAATCASDTFCDTTTGICKPTPCASVSCPAGRVCVNSTGKCTDDPCERVHCATHQTCVVKDDGSADCANPTVGGIPVDTQTSGSGLAGCKCSLGGGGARDRGASLALLVGVAAGWNWLRKRRERRRSNQAR